MSEKLTRIRLPGQKAFSGYMEWDEKSAAEMVAAVRSRAAHLRAEVEAIEAAADADFQIDVVRGPYVQRHVREVQKARVDA
jgi:hypothetical protein